MDETPATSSAGSGLPGLRGVDHVGTTVPDMEQATAFFVDVLGCELLYEREPPRDDAPRDRLGVPAGRPPPDHDDRLWTRSVLGVITPVNAATWKG